MPRWPVAGSTPRGGGACWPDTPWRLPAGGPVPWFVFDAGYDSAQLSLDLGEAPVVVLVRLRSDRCFYPDPPPRPPGAGGRPRRHGAKFAFADPTTWPAPTTTHVATDDQ